MILLRLSCFSLLLAQFIETLLLYPASTLLQLTATLSIPVADLPADRHVLFDWGFQMNYDMPFDLATFYNAPLWPGITSGRRQKKRSVNTTQYAAAHKRKLPLLLATNKQHNDFTAAQLYRGFEQLLLSHGLHETCLLRSICELARHPFANDQQQNILMHILTFLLTPSLHQGFAANEHTYRTLYESAELHGFLGEDCALFYATCDWDFLSLLTKVSYLI